MEPATQEATRQHADLTDALACGRLALAEVAAIPPRELDALYELGAQCLDTGRDTEAIELLAGLVTLFPFSASYWRAYAIALHRSLLLDRARAAYDAALLLQPDHGLSRCYRAEVLLYLGRTLEAHDAFEALSTSTEPAVQRRVSELQRQLALLHDWKPPPAPRPAPTALAAEETLTLTDARPLPLENGRFNDEPSPLTDEERREVTRTARIVATVIRDDSFPIGEARPDITATAILPRAAAARGVRTGNTGASPAPERTETALLPGRRGRAAARDPGEEVTQTAVNLRRSGAPLVGGGTHEDDDV